MMDDYSDDSLTSFRPAWRRAFWVRCLFFFSSLLEVEKGGPLLLLMLSFMRLSIFILRTSITVTDAHKKNRPEEDDCERHSG